MTTKNIEISICLDSDGERKFGRFEGFAYLESGFLAGTIDGPGSAFNQAQLVLLTAFTLTGCPIAARSSGNVSNPWLLTNGAYRGNRRLVARDFEAKATLVADSVNDRIGMRLQVTCNGTMPRLKSIAAPFQEAIEQVSRGRLKGHFDVAFIGEAGSEIRAHAESGYELDIVADVAPAWRNITILSFYEDAGLRQIEQIDLFGSQNDAELDLSRKGATLKAV
jgi:hypothetical protein